MKGLVTLLTLFGLMGGQAQTVRRDKISPFTIRGNIGIQKPISSARFHKSFAGLYEANLSFNARLGEKFSLGLGYQSTYFKNNQFLRFKYFNAELPYHTSLVCDGGFLRLGYDHFYKTNGFVGYALNMGYMVCRYTNVNNDTSALNKPLTEKRFESPYIQPEISFNFVMEQRLAFSLFISYTTVFYQYDARAPRLNHFPEIQEKRNNYLISYINFGFGFTVLLGS